jgi:hypothetical protein
MRGLVGAISPMLGQGGQAMAAKMAPAPAPQRRGILQGFNPLRFEDNGMSGSERLMGIGALLADLGGGQGNVAAVQQMRQQQAEREAEAQQRQAQQAFARSLIGGPMTKGQAGGAQGGGSGVLTPREAAPALLEAQALGLDTGDALAVLNAAAPQVRYERGFRYDERDPSSGPDYVPNLPDAVAPTIEGGRVVRVDNIPGAIEARQATETAINDARNASDARYANIRAREAALGTGQGSAAYDLVTVTGPNGQPVTMSRAQALGMGVIEGRSPDEQAYATAVAGNRAAREDAAETRGSAAQRLLPSLDEMERLLPDVIAGAAADQRLAASRALALFNNERAIRESTATQVFQNEARQVVSQIIRAFGANPTEGERRYAEQMSGADVNYTPEALREGIRLARARAARDIADAPSAQRQTPAQGPARPRNRAEFDALPSGTVFIDPNGVERRKP